MMSRNPDIIFVTEYIKNVLYFATVKQGKSLKSTSEVHYFSIDNELIYENYYSDFGPLNLGCVFKYCQILNEKLNLYMHKQTIVHYSSVDPKRKANSAFLLGCYGVLYLSLTPSEALKPLVIHGQTYRPFQDATLGDSMHTISILDCLTAIQKARRMGFFDFHDFNYEEYQRLDKIQGGDLNWIVPGKFLAFIGPVDYNVSLYHPPEMYIEYFLDNNVKIVIRLNKRMYDGNTFSNSGILHYDLFFPDGSCPPRHILLKFLQISEEATGAIAVHCKAGLGRTGSLIGGYLIKHYRMTAHEAIGWMRICRPGSVIGHQQSWLEQLEPWLIKQGNIYRKRVYQDIEKFPVHTYGVYSIAERAQRKEIPLMLRKSPTPPPPIQRQTRSEITPPLRPQASRIRGVPNETPVSEQEQSKWHMKPMKLHLQQRTCNRPPPVPASYLVKPKVPVDLSNAAGAQRGFAAGEPRSVTRPRVGNRPINTTRLQSERPKDKPVEQQYQTVHKRNYNAHTQLPAVSIYNTSQGPTIKTLSDARNFLMRTSVYKDQREKQLKSSLVVTPQVPNSYRLPSYTSERPLLKSDLPTSFNSTQRPTQPANRRRLGRSPSPSPSSSPTRARAARATNTAMTMTASHRKDSKVALNEALARLIKWPTARDCSVGATSLGAPRAAPRPTLGTSLSVRSDERPIATQGDMLNSIKFQRQLRDSLATKPNISPVKPGNSQPGHNVSHQTQPKTHNVGQTSSYYAEHSPSTRLHCSTGTSKALPPPRPNPRPMSPTRRARQSTISAQHRF